jgi:nitrogenase molybdenum-cofactor synthesis protein NifE
MLRDKLAKAFDEPGCATNQAKSATERKRGCSAKALTPGAAAGGCAFDGAKIALQPITDAAHLVHGPIACEGNSWDSRHTLSSGPQLFRVGMTTDMSELDIIHGGERKLFHAIKEIVERYRPAAVFVYVTCVPALIGDDVEAVCSAAAQRFATPVIPVVAPGFAGSKNLGNKLAGQALLDHVIGSEEPEASTPYDINLIGEYNVAGELWQVRPLLDRLGIRVLASITGDGRYRDVACAHRARVNMVVCSQAMMALARQMRERYGIPYFEGSFYGIRNTSDAFRQLSAMLIGRGAPRELEDRVAEVITEEEERATGALAPYRPRLRGKRSYSTPAA